MNNKPRPHWTVEERAGWKRRDRAKGLWVILLRPMARLYKNWSYIVLVLTEVVQDFGCNLRLSLDLTRLKQSTGSLSGWFLTTLTVPRTEAQKEAWTGHLQASLMSPLLSIDKRGLTSLYTSTTMASGTAWPGPTLLLIFSLMVTEQGLPRTSLISLSLSYGRSSSYVKSSFGRENSKQALGSLLPFPCLLKAWGSASAPFL